MGLVIAFAARHLFRDERSGFFALAGLTATPIFGLGTMYVSTDIALCLLALAVPLLAAVCILEDRPRLWIATGFLGGLGGLAKFPAVLYVPVVLALALLHPNGRRHLRRPEPWLGAALGAIAVSPVLIWAAEHQFDNITMQLVDRQVRSSHSHPEPPGSARLRPNAR